MICGIGTDIIEVGRIKKSIERQGQPFLNRVFTADEQAYCMKYKEPAPHFAGYFAAKEAISKSLGVGLGAELAWLDMEICHDAQGKPYCQFSSEAASRLQFPTIHLSISHCHEYATATALCERN